MSWGMVGYAALCVVVPVVWGVLVVWASNRIEHSLGGHQGSDRRGRRPKRPIEYHI